MRGRPVVDKRLWLTVCRQLLGSRGGALQRWYAFAAPRLLSLAVLSSQIGRLRVGDGGFEVSLLFLPVGSRSRAVFGSSWVRICTVLLDDGYPPIP